MAVIRKFAMVFLGVSALCFPCAPFAQQTGANAETSCRRFVQSFYDWYVPIALQEHSGPASDIALKEKRSAFDPSLVRQLQEEGKIQEQVQDAGLDFDPFLNSQDPSPEFKVAKVTVKGDKCWATVNGLLQGRKEEKLVAELYLKDPLWRFANFYYSPGNLLQLLKSLRTRAPHKSP